MKKYMIELRTRGKKEIEADRFINDGVSVVDGWTDFYVKSDKVLRVANHEIISIEVKTGE